MHNSCLLTGINLFAYLGFAFMTQVIEKIRLPSIYVHIGLIILK